MKERDYVVVNEEILGVSIPYEHLQDYPPAIQILKSKATQHMGDPNPGMTEGPFNVTNHKGETTIRPATIQDFENYRVQPPPNYTNTPTLPKYYKGHP